MRVAIDTNILTRSIQADSPLHASARQAVASLRAQDNDLCVFPQNLYEFWAVCTRPRADNGLGMTVQEAWAELEMASSLFGVLADHNESGLLLEWLQLVRNHDVKGKNAHDARLVAAMKVHGITHILTFNTADFVRFPDITVLAPEHVLQAPK